MHHKRINTEAKDEFYQALYESAYLVWLELALKADVGHRLEHTCLLVYFWFCITQTYKLNDVEESAPQIALSAKIIGAIVSNL